MARAGLRRGHEDDGESPSVSTLLAGDKTDNANTTKSEDASAKDSAGREKLEELGGGVFARVGQDRWHGVGVAEGQCVHSGVKECPIPAC